jgi:subtilisin family serine protease
MDENGHGTHVSGIIAGNDSIITGIAPDAKIVAVKALGSSGLGYESDIIAGIDYCISHADEYNISVISMSLGGNKLYNDYCDSSELEFSYMINEAVSAGISVVVATGNNGSSSSILSPACIYGATRVGSSLKSDNELSSFSNRWDLDMLIAPGSDIYSSYLGNTYVYMSGTSIATPMVSGAVAILNQYYHEIGEISNPYNIKSTLQYKGKTITQDGRIIQE